MNEWFLNKGDIHGMNPNKDNMTVSKDGGDVDAITAATISSRAFLDAVNRGIKTQESNSTDAYSGATEVKEDSTVTVK
jgi:electron transport complex protein RnfG